MRGRLLDRTRWRVFSTRRDHVRCETARKWWARRRPTDTSCCTSSSGRRVHFLAVLLIADGDASTHAAGVDARVLLELPDPVEHFACMLGSLRKTVVKGMTHWQCADLKPAGQQQARQGLAPCVHRGERRRRHRSQGGVLA